MTDETQTRRALRGLTAAAQIYKHRAANPAFTPQKRHEAAALAADIALAAALIDPEISALAASKLTDRSLPEIVFFTANQLVLLAGRQPNTPPGHAMAARLALTAEFLRRAFPFPEPTEGDAHALATD